MFVNTKIILAILKEVIHKFWYDFFCSFSINQFYARQRRKYSLFNSRALFYYDKLVLQPFISFSDHSLYFLADLSYLRIAHWSFISRHVENNS